MTSVTRPAERPEIQVDDVIVYTDESTVESGPANGVIQCHDGSGIAVEDVIQVRRRGAIIWRRPETAQE